MDMNKMFNGKKLLSRFFRPVDNVVWDLMTGKIGIVGSEGITTIEGTGEDPDFQNEIYCQILM